MPTMFSTPTTLVIGAGASWDYGLPLGRELWEQITTRCVGQLTHWEQYVRESFPSLNGYLQSLRGKDPVGFAYISALNTMGDAHKKAVELAAAVKRADVHFNVDDFLRDNPSCSRAIQVLVAGSLFTKLYEVSDGRWRLRKALFARELRVGNGREATDNWVRYFVGTCRPLLGEKNTPVKVVSFNYDRLVETLLRRFWSETERQYAAFEECFEFIYPYGAFSVLPEELNAPGIWLQEQGPRIGTVSNLDQDMAARVAAAITGATQVFLVGFSCTPTNENLLGLRRDMGSKVFAQHYKQKDQRFARTCERLNIFHLDHGSMPELVQNGFFEQRYET